MREQPWNTRRLFAEHSARYQTLLIFHSCSLALVAESESPEKDDLELGVADLLAKPLGTLPPEALLNDTQPSDVLATLEKEIRSRIQKTLERVLKLSSHSKQEEALSTLEQAAWNHGKTTAEERLKLLRLPATGSPTEAEMQNRQNLIFVRSLILDCTWDTPPGVPPFLCERAVPWELRLQHLHCPHQQDHKKSNVSDRILELECQLEMSWYRGLAYGIHPQLRFETLRPDRSDSTRCLSIWTRASTH